MCSYWRTAVGYEFKKKNTDVIKTATISFYVAMVRHNINTDKLYE